eukprot:Clim_evm24s146 gene=Clim_evmTU24s146
MLRQIGMARSSRSLHRVPCSVSVSAKRKKVSLAVLDHRSHLAVKGRQAGGFLQGLVSNDMKEITSDQKAMYTFLLNNKGRIHSDMLIFAAEAPEWPQEAYDLPRRALPDMDVEYYIETDGTRIEGLKKLLQRFKLRKKISLTIATDTAAVALFDDEVMRGSGNTEALTRAREILQGSSVVLSADPRFAALGYRGIVTKGGLSKLFDVLRDLGVKHVDATAFRDHRIYCGVAEGCEELIEDKSLPFESNGDFLHGVNLNKGCYLGQELTAITYHRGVTRKRLFRITFEGSAGAAFKGAVVRCGNGKNSGSVVAVDSEGKFGLALLRFLNIGDWQAQDSFGVEVETKEGDRIKAIARKPLFFENERLYYNMGAKEGT